MSLTVGDQLRCLRGEIRLQLSQSQAFQGLNYIGMPSACMTNTDFTTGLSHRHALTRRRPKSSTTAEYTTKYVASKSQSSEVHSYIVYSQGGS